MPQLNPDLLLRAYSAGIFPMAEGRTSDELYWVEPRRRGVIPIEGFHLSRSLAKLLRQERFALTANRAFRDVMLGCAAPSRGREDTWINEDILNAYGQLHERGHAHSVECWLDGALAGGLYGVHIGGAFFGESMFTRARDASKAAMAHLIARLRIGGFRLLDTQFLTEHLASLGAVEIPRAAYRAQLASALSFDADFAALDRLDGALSEEAPVERPATTVCGPISGKLIVQLLTQTS
jgi:leucyl/phenylalanyl-tRNA--protein transferase